jgi:hypothetical protein
MYTAEQIEILMMVAGALEPVDTALEVRRRWQYIQRVAEGACRGQTLDDSLPQVLRDGAAWAARARGIITVIDEWLTDQQRRSA